MICLLTKTVNSLQVAPKLKEVKQKYLLKVMVSAQRLPESSSISTTQWSQNSLLETSITYELIWECLKQ